MIIKCPECGRQISDRAPKCPNCGVEIAGKIVRCSNCGEVYFLADRLCPSCHQINGRVSSANVETVNNSEQSHPKVAPQQQAKVTQPSESAMTPPVSGESPEQAPKKNYTALIVSFAFAAIICGGMFFFYFHSQSANEEKEYELALKSDDPLILQAYLDKFNGENPEHFNNIKERLDSLKQEENDWNNILVANSRQQYEQYCREHPNSIHRQEAMNKIDSIDWTVAVSSNNKEALQRYIAQHPDGIHVSEAQIQMDQLAQTAESNTEVQPEEQNKVKTVIRKFFQAINSKNENSLRSAVTSTLSFNGKSGSTPDDVVTYMNKLYKSGASNFNFVIDWQSITIEKEPQPVDVTTTDKPKYAYPTTVNATKKTNSSDGSSSEDYTISATVSPDGKISGISIARN